MINSVSVNGQSYLLFYCFPYTHTHHARILNFATENYDVLGNHQSTSLFRHHFLYTNNTFAFNFLKIHWRSEFFVFIFLIVIALFAFKASWAATEGGAFAPTSELFTHFLQPVFFSHNCL